MDAARLAELDAGTLEVLDAVAHVKAPRNASLSTPHAFATTSGKVCWVKAQSQHGLATELIAGRLAALLTAGPAAHVVAVPSEALPADGSANHLQGVLVGTEDVAGGVNDRELGLVGVTALDPATIDARQRAVVVAFQSWIGLGDLQVLIDLRTGRILSHDNGECFGDVANLADPTLLVHPLPGIGDAHGSDAASVAAAMARVESVSDDDLLRAVACVPAGATWNSDPGRRLQIAQWLVHRRGKLEEVMRTW